MQYGIGSAQRDLLLRFLGEHLPNLLIDLKAIADSQSQADLQFEGRN